MELVISHSGGVGNLLATTIKPGIVQQAHNRRRRAIGLYEEAAARERSCHGGFSRTVLGNRCPTLGTIGVAIGKLNSSPLARNPKSTVSCEFRQVLTPPPQYLHTLRHPTEDSTPENAPGRTYLTISLCLVRRASSQSPQARSNDGVAPCSNLRWPQPKLNNDVRIPKNSRD